MDWRESAASGVPEDPTPGPEALRGDIADELNDHLSCAMQRELRRTGDESEAQKAVLDRFGDPRQVARQLWWDAVKERVMRDRILLAAVAVVTLASLLVSVAALRAVQQGQQVNQAVLAKIAELPLNAPTPELTGDWSMAVIKAVSDGDAKPMADVTVRLKGHIFNATDEGELRAQTDKAGVATIGPIKAGQYEFSAWVNGHYAEYKDFAFFPGRKKEFTIVAPHAERPTVPVGFQITVPDNLNTNDLVLKVDPARADSIRLGWWSWRPPHAPQLFLGLDGKIMKVAYNNESRKYFLEPAAETADTVLLPPGVYYLSNWELFVVEPGVTDETPRQLISIERSFHFDKISFKAVVGEKTHVPLDLTKNRMNSSIRKKSLQELKDAAVMEFTAKKKDGQ